MTRMQHQCECGVKLRYSKTDRRYEPVNPELPRAGHVPAYVIADNETRKISDAVCTAPKDELLLARLARPERRRAQHSHRLTRGWLPDPECGECQRIAAHVKARGGYAPRGKVQPRSNPDKGDK